MTTSALARPGRCARARAGGRNLHRGRYRVTLRALDQHGEVLWLSRPVTVRVR